MGAAALKAEPLQRCPKPVLPALRARWRERAKSCASLSISLPAPSPIFGPTLKRLRIAMAVLAALCILFGVGLHLFDRQAEAARAREHSLDGQIALHSRRAPECRSPDEPARQRAVAQPRTGPQQALRSESFFLDPGHGSPRNRPARRRAGHLYRAHPRQGRSHHRASPRRRTPRPRSRPGAQSRAVQAIPSAAHRGRKRRVQQQPRPANGAGRPLQSLRLRFAGGLQSAHAGRAHGRKKENGKRLCSCAFSVQAKPAPRSRGVPAVPQQPGRQPHTGPSQPAPRTKPAPGGPQ